MVESLSNAKHNIHCTVLRLYTVEYRVDCMLWVLEKIKHVVGDPAGRFHAKYTVQC